MRRCDGKSAYSSKKAEKAARLASKRTGDLIVAYMCYHCGKWHIGHADKSQHIVRAETDRRGLFTLSEDCPHCGKPIPEERRYAAWESGANTVYCSKNCKKVAKKLHYSRQSEGIIGTRSIETI